MDELRQNEIDSELTGRSLPLQVNYHGFPLYARLEYADKGQERRIAKVVVSYREQIAEPLKRRKKQYGKAILERKYSPIGDGMPEEVILNTMDTVVPTAFLPDLFQLMPELMTGDLTCAVVLPTALGDADCYRRNDCQAAKGNDRDSSTMGRSAGKGSDAGAVRAGNPLNGNRNGNKLHIAAAGIVCGVTYTDCR